MQYLILSFFLLTAVLQKSFCQSNEIDSLKLLLIDEPDSLKVHHLLEIAEITSKINFAQAIEPYEDAVNLAQKLQDKKLEAQINYKLARVHWWSGDCQEAMKLDNYTLKLYQELQDTAGIGRTLIGMGASCQHLEMKDLALEYLMRAMEYGEVSDNKELQIRACQNISVVLWSLGKEELSYSYIDKGLDLIDGNDKYERNKVDLLLSKGSNLFDQKRFDESLEILLFVHEKYIEFDVPSKSLATFSLITYIEQIKQVRTPGEIVEQYEEICEKSTDLGDYPNLLNGLNRLSNYLIELNRVEEAEILVDSLHRVLDDVDSPLLYLESLSLSEKIYFKKGEFRKSSTVLKEYIHHSDSINGYLNQESLSTMMSFLEIERKNSEISELKQKAADDELISNQKSLILTLQTVLLIVVLIMSVFVFRYFRITSRQKLKLREENDRLLETNKLLNSQRDLLGELNKKHENEKSLSDQATMAKSELLSNMSHELRTPLNWIFGICTVMQTTPLSKEELQENIRLLNFSASNLLNMINDFLDYCKLEAQQVKLEYREEDIHDYIKILFDSTKILTDTKGLELKKEISGLIPQRLLCDKTRLNQVLNNLINNSLKFTHHGFIAIGVSVLNRTDQTTKLRFSIEDTGIGISEENQDKIFERFGQADVSIARKYGGTGLGLSICKSLLKEMGSKLMLESEHGTGSKFYFDLELDVAKEEVKNEIPSAIPSAGDEIDWKSLHVLVVDDNEINRMVLAAMLGSKEVKVSFAENGEMALRSIEQQNFDCVLMDIEMPVMDGFEAVSLILKDWPNLPVVAITAQRVDEFYSHENSSLFAGLICKPESVTKVLTVLTKILTKSLV